MLKTIFPVLQPLIQADESAIVHHEQCTYRLIGIDSNYRTGPQIFACEREFQTGDFEDSVKIRTTMNIAQTRRLNRRYCHLLAYDRTIVYIASFDGLTMYG